MATDALSFSPDPLVVLPERLRLALLAGRDQDLRRYIQQAGARAPDVRQQIRRTAQVRPVQVRGRRGGQIHLMAMPVLLHFGQDVMSPGEVRLFTLDTAVASRMQAWWRSVTGAEVWDLRVLPHAVHLEAVLGIAPTVVHELAFWGASLVEGSRLELPKLRLSDRCVREGGQRSLVPYLVMALVTCASDLAVDEAAWRRGQLDAQALLGAMFAMSQARPLASLLPPSGFFEAVDVAQAAQLTNAVNWVKRNGGTHHLELRQCDHGHLTVECRYELPTLERPGRMIWDYDGTWREPPELAVAAAGDDFLRNGGGASWPRGYCRGRLGEEPLH